MKEQTDINTRPPVLDEREVAAYLEAHPDFFVRHDGLLSELKIPHASGAAVSLLERQLQVIREKNGELERQLKSLARTAQGNEKLLERLQAMILKLISSTDLDDALRLIDRSLRDDFHADFVALRLFGDWARPENIDPENIDPEHPSLKTIATTLSRRVPVCGYLTPEQKAFLFGSQAEQVVSGLLIPLCESPCDACLGVVAVGSVDPKRFHPEMGTAFVAHLGAVTTRILRTHLEGSRG